MERFNFKNEKVVIIQNVNSIKKKIDEDHFLIKILFTNATVGWVYYGKNKYLWEKDFNRFCEGDFLK